MVILPAGMNLLMIRSSALYLILPLLQSGAEKYLREVFMEHTGPITIVDTKPTGVINSTGSTEATHWK